MRHAAEQYRLEALLPFNPDRLSLGAYVVVRYGTTGEQLARFYGYTTKAMRLAYRVQKWRANSGRWTAPVPVVRADLLREATAADLKKFKPASGAPMGAK